jgi:hypothetical protein
MKTWIGASAVLFLCLAAVALGDESFSGAQPCQTNISSARLLLPYYVVDSTDPGGTTTLFGVRNQNSVPITLEISYFRTDRPQAPQRRDVVVLEGKAIESINIAFTRGLHVDEDGMARGYVIIEALDEGAQIQGDYYLLTPDEDYATGFRLVNADPSNAHNEFCNVFTVRFLNGGGFDSSTRYLIWRDLDASPNTGEPAFFVAAYDEAGELLTVREFTSDQVAMEVQADEILEPAASRDFGAFEFQFAGGAVGHISAIMSASGRYSVGLEATCGD